MQFKDLPTGAKFRQAKKHSRFGKAIFTKLPPAQRGDEQTACSICGLSTGVWNAHNGWSRVHFCPAVTVYEV